MGPDFTATLRALLAAGVSACEQRYGDASASTLIIEATGDEVVQVTARDASPALAECLTEAGWVLRLGPEFDRHRSYAVPLTH